MLINPSVAEVPGDIPKWGLNHIQIAVRGISQLPGPECADESTDSCEQDPEWAISSQNVLGTHVVPVLWINKTCFSLSIHPAPLSSTKSPVRRQAGRNDPLSCAAVKGSIVVPDGFITPLCVIPYTRAYVPKSEKWPVMCVRVCTHSFSLPLCSEAPKQGWLLTYLVKGTKPRSAVPRFLDRLCIPLPPPDN